MAVRAVRRADAPPPEAHRRQALQVRTVRPQLLQVGPPRTPHEEAPIVAPDGGTCVVVSIYLGGKEAAAD